MENDGLASSSADLAPAPERVRPGATAFPRIRVFERDGRIITLTDDGYRIRFTVIGSPNVDSREEFLWAEYKQCDLPGIGHAIADELMEPLLVGRSEPHEATAPTEAKANE